MRSRIRRALLAVGAALNVSAALRSIPYEELDLNQPWEQLDIQHPLTTQGIEKFVADYRSTLNPAA